MTVSPPIRVVAVVGLLVATALGLFLFLAGRQGGSGDTTASATPVTRPTGRSSATAAPRTTAPRRAAGRPETKPTSGFPAAIDRAFRRHRVVVVVVYMPASMVDALVRGEARAGAIRSGAGYVAVSALSERLVRALVAKTGVLPDPAVVVLRRPGIVTTTLGVTDRETVAQAVAQAKR